jgi:cellulose biosynthesis protein BcsQ
MEFISSRTKSVFITFYSFKGGVGRTMSLLNVACILAGRGRRVLMIDFDLEAPGLTLFKQNQRKNQPPPRQAGLVELIQDFLRNPEESPLADKDNPASFRDHYVRSLPIPKKLRQLEGGYLDLMPSGRIDETLPAATLQHQV